MSEELRLPPESDHGDDDPKAVTTVLTGLVAVVLLVVMVVGLEALHLRATEAERHRKVIAAQPQELRQVQNEHLETLNGYRWVNKEEGVVAIPIDRAMQLVVEEARGSGSGQ